MYSVFDFELCLLCTLIDRFPYCCSMIYQALSVYYRFNFKLFLLFSVIVCFYRTILPIFYKKYADYCISQQLLIVIV